MFKKISLINLIANLEAAMRRFPMPALVSVCAATTAIILIHDQNADHLVKILMVLAFSFPLLVSSMLIYETNSFEKKYKHALDLAIVIFMATYYFLLPKDISDDAEMIFVRHALWVLAAIAIFTFAGLAVKKKSLVNAFWQYNKNIVFSGILTGIYTVTIGVGLTVALASISHLFELSVDGERFAEIWAILWSLFAPLFFLSRMPKNLLELENDTSYPRELRLFGQFVLLPLVTIYFLILYAYTIKVVVSWTWPKGTLAYMISGFSLLGVFTYAVLYPLRGAYGWARKFGKIFFAVLIPQVGMLFWALWFRISQYSVTENRALVFIFGCWLLGMAIYFLVSKAKDIRLIPASLCAVLIVVSFGPWSIFDISRRLQTERLMTILEKYDAVSQGKIAKAKDKQAVSNEDREEISGIIGYLYQMHGREYVQALSSESIMKPGEENNEAAYMTAREVVENVVGVDYRTRSAFENDEYFRIHSDKARVYDVAGYKQAMVIEYGGLANDAYSYSFNNRTAVLEILKNDKPVAIYDFDKFIKETLENNDKSRGNIIDNNMVFQGENNMIKYAIQLASLSGQTVDPEDGDKYNGLSISGIVLFTDKSEK